MTKTQHLVPVVCDQTCVRKPAKYYFYLPCCAFFFFLSSLSLSTLLPVCWQDDSQGFNLKASAFCEGQGGFSMFCFCEGQGCFSIICFVRYAFTRLR